MAALKLRDAEELMLASEQNVAGGRCDAYSALCFLQPEKDLEWTKQYKAWQMSRLPLVILV